MKLDTLEKLSLFVRYMIRDRYRHYGRDHEPDTEEKIMASIGALPSLDDKDAVADVIARGINDSEFAMHGAPFNRRPDNDQLAKLNRLRDERRNDVWCPGMVKGGWLWDFKLLGYD